MSRAFNFGDIALRPSIHLANVLLVWVMGTVMISAQYQTPGLYWHHTHPYEESYQQGLDGMPVEGGCTRYACSAPSAPVVTELNELEKTDTTGGGEDSPRRR
jgi:hypothetical protein